MPDDIHIALSAALYVLNTIPNKRIDYANNLRTTYALAAYIEQVLKRHNTTGVTHDPQHSDLEVRD